LARQQHDLEAAIGLSGLHSCFQHLFADAFSKVGFSIDDVFLKLIGATAPADVRQHMEGEYRHNPIGHLRPKHFWTAVSKDGPKIFRDKNTRTGRLLRL